ncbi:MAG: ATP-binding protein [Eubacteriales bacterium]|nr:ATP-binding protein [Eubacteriales bacterium]
MMQIDWANTPGGFYAFTYCLCSIAVLLNCPLKFDKVKSVLITSGFGVILFVIMTITHGVTRLLFAPLMTFFIMLIWLNIWIITKFDFLTALYFAARIFIMGELLSSTTWMLCYYLVSWQIMPLRWLAVIPVTAAGDCLLAFIMFLLEKGNRGVNERIRVSAKELLSTAAITLASYSVSNLSYIFEAGNHKQLLLSQLFLGRTLMDLGGVAILYAFHVQLGQMNSRFEVERLQDILEMQTHNYEMLEQSVNAVNQKYHDLKYQISILKNEYGSGKSIAYLEQMEQDIKAYEAQNKTGNQILDTILTGKTLYCQNNWIELTAVADGKELDFMDPIDISTLFGNMIDNAIESVIKIEKKERRLIHLTIAKQKGFLRIRMENCYDEKPEFKDGLPITTKKDKNYHGFGVRSIQNIVKKYGGSTTMAADNGWFELRILIPLK